jgi:V8-like Glu-specific endopeptidase
MSVLRWGQHLATLLLGPLVVGGGPADQTYPFMGSMQPEGYAHYCGATLISPQWMVTAAHCVEGKDPATTVIRIGSGDRTSGGELIQAAEFVAHPRYNGADYDIALIKLARPSSMMPASIAGSSPQPGTATRLLGWGQTCPQRGCARRGPAGLKQLDTTVVDDRNCQEFNSANELCVGGTTNSTACYGDSGGPALIRSGTGWALAGATSRGGNDSSTCGTGNAIYTDVTAFRSWISQFTRDCPGTVFHGSLAAQGDTQETLSFLAGAGPHRACLDGPDSADFDLSLERWDGTTWSTVSTSDSPGSHETLTYDGVAGYYRYRVVSARGSGGYTLAFGAKDPG